MDTLIQEKVNQAIEILQDLKIDAWLTFVRETSAVRDPVIPLIYGHDLTWQSALILTKTGERFAIVGQYEAETARRSGAYTTVIPYDEAISASLLHTLERIYPSKIAINYSIDDVQADGLSYGLYQVLLKYFEATPWEQRLISAENIIRSLRSRKTEEEVRRIKSAVATTEEIFQQTYAYAKTLMTEKQISDFMHSRVVDFGCETGWESEHCPIVNAGAKSKIGHVGPTDLPIMPGELLHLDFGVMQEGYCSDLQRVVYFLAPGEEHPPKAVQQAFDTVVQAIQVAVSSIKPGLRGVDIDTVARKIVTDAGYPEYKYATGHQIGRTVHDGAGILGPQWERYGATPSYIIEAGNVYTVEPGVLVPGYGYLGIEEDILVTENGAEFLSTPQTTLIVR
jgi:Xaa-Pro aminopeptidase